MYLKKKIPAAPTLLGLGIALMLLMALSWLSFYGHLVSLYNIYPVLLLQLITFLLAVAFLVENYVKNKKPNSFTKKVRLFVLLVGTAYVVQMLWLIYFLISFGRALNTLD